VVDRTQVLRENEGGPAFEAMLARDDEFRIGQSDGRHSRALRSPLTLNRRRSRKPPSVPFKIPRAILALPIWLIDRLRIDERTGRARPLVVRITEATAPSGG
jgi:hypothetical protein